MSRFTESELEEYRDAALAFVNKTRAERDAPQLDQLPQGVPGECTKCVLSVALQDLAPSGRAAAFSDVWLLHEDQRGTVLFVDLEYAEKVATPDAVRDFIEAFDHGAYPDLVLDLEPA